MPYCQCLDYSQSLWQWGVACCVLLWQVMFRRGDWGQGRGKNEGEKAIAILRGSIFLSTLWFVLGKHLCQDDLKFPSILQLGFFFPFNHFLAWTIFLPVCSHLCMHRQSWTSNPCQLTHHMGIQRPRTWSVFLGTTRDWDFLPRDRHTAA